MRRGLAVAGIAAATVVLLVPARTSATLPTRAMTITVGSSNYASGHAQPDGRGQVTARAGDSLSLSSIHLKWDGASLDMSAQGATVPDPELALFNWTGLSDQSNTSTGNHALGARCVLTDTSSVQHVIEVPSTGELLVNCS